MGVVFAGACDRHEEALARIRLDEIVHGVELERA
jgi:hypothetical protein